MAFYNSEVSSFFNSLNKKKDEYDRLIKEKEEHKKNLELKTQERVCAEKVRSKLQTAAEMVQQNLEKRINTIVQMALDIVFDSAPEFTLNIVQRRNQTEADILVDGLKPLESDAGGVIDIIAFALRLALWSIKPNRKTFIIDEPFRNLSKDLQPRAAEMLKTLSDNLGVQIIMVSHHTVASEYADKTFFCEKRNKKSHISILEG